MSDALPFALDVIRLLREQMEAGTVTMPDWLRQHVEAVRLEGDKDERKED